MKTNLQLLTAVFASAILFVILFYQKSPGINLLIFESVIIALLFYLKRITADIELIITLLGTIISAIVVVIHNSNLAIFVNVLSLILLIGKVLYPVGGSLLYAIGFAGPHLLHSQLELFKKLNALGSKKPRLAKLIKWFRIILISVIVIALFVILYQISNPVFGKLISGITTRIEAFFNAIFEVVDVGIILTFLLGLVICDFLILKTINPRLENEVNSATDYLFRRKYPIKSASLNMEFKREWKAAFVVLCILNLLLVVVNIIDIYWVWFNFKWDGDYLKQFVHEGTYMLLLSIIISVGISLYLFRSNLNFFSKNKSIKILTYIWLSQNIILAISVGVRNMHYIYYYALAYKRIGVIFFLGATIIGLITVIVKIRQKRSVHFLLRMNVMSVYIILMVMTLFNWDVVIARYNFSHASRSFVHFNFLWDLSYNALPYLKKDLNELIKIEKGNDRFPSKISYMPASTYHELVHNRIDHFNKRYEKQHWLSWNYASHKAYNALNKPESK
jgi:hypothetical protein